MRRVCASGGCNPQTARRIPVAHLISSRSTHTFTNQERGVVSLVCLNEVHDLTSNLEVVAFAAVDLVAGGAKEAVTLCRHIDKVELPSDLKKSLVP